jgi:hypothetical protein
MFMDLHIIEKNIEIRKIRGSTEMAVPNRATLLALKLKAIWDRQYRIEHDLCDDLLWETGKVVKDRADVLALLDPGHGGRDLNIYVLGKLLRNYPFLERSLISVYETNEGIKKYSRISQSFARDIIEQLLSLTR